MSSVGSSFDIKDGHNFRCLVHSKSIFALFQSYEKRLKRLHVCLSVRMSVWQPSVRLSALNNSTLAGRISFKFCIGALLDTTLCVRVLCNCCNFV